MKSLAILAAFAAFFVSGTATAEAPPQQQPEAEQATVTKLVVKRPPRTVHRVREFRTPTRPTPAYVFNTIVPHEAQRWGASRYVLARRIACESHGQWWATNGQYSGVLQFSPGTFWRGMSTIRSKVVTLTTVKTRRMHSRVYRYWSDGRLTRSKGRIVRQTVVTRLRASIANNTTWLQVRIGAQANAGRSAVHDSEWSCR
jgi:hypothetical protein